MKTISQPCKKAHCALSIEKNDITNAGRIDGLKNAKKKLVRDCERMWKKFTAATSEVYRFRDLGGKE